MARSNEPGHWIKPAARCKGPAVVLGIIAETYPILNSQTPNSAVLALRQIHVAESHRIRDNWTDPGYHLFDSGEALFDWLESATSAHKRVHCFTPSATATLRLASFFERIDQHGAYLEGAKLTPKRGRKKRRKRIIRGVGTVFDPAPPSPPVDHAYHFSTLIQAQTLEIVRYRTAGRGFQWCNFSQYLDVDEEQIAAVIYHRWSQTPALDSSIPNRERTPRERAFLWCRFFRGLSDWWTANDGGPWGPSTAACAYSFLRRRIHVHSILHHDDDAGRLEEAAIFGGRRQVWFVGNVGTVHDWRPFKHCAPTRSDFGHVAGGMDHHDVRSMYPYLLARLPFPVKLLTFKRSAGVAWCQEALERYGVLAQVRLMTPHAEYPQRTRDGITFPVGRFWTTLCGVELATALSAGLVEKVGAAALYEMGEPFKAASEKLLQLREQFRERDEPAWELFAKALGNSMSGKIAQRPWTWSPRPMKAARERWGCWRRTDPKTKEQHEYRALAGMVWEKVRTERKPRPMGGAYAYLTSYGRWYMSWFRSLCPPRTVLAQDTDGIWTTAAGSAALYPDGDSTSRTSGHLHHDKWTPAGRFFGPQSYWWGDGWVLSGQSIPIIRPGSTIATVKETSAPLWGATAPPAPVIFERRAVRDIGRLQVAGGIDDDGWVKPVQAWMMPEEADQVPALG